MQPTFENYRYQFQELWKVIEQADPAQRRVLIVELAMLLIEWDSEQSDKLERVQSLKYSGHLNKIAISCASQMKQLVKYWGSEKAQLTQALTEHQKELGELRERVVSEETKVYDLSEKMQLMGKDRAELQHILNGFKEQLQVLQQINNKSTQVEQERAAARTLEDVLQRGDDPSGALAAVATLVSFRGQLMEYYQSYCDMSQSTQKNMISTQGEAVSHVQHESTRITEALTQVAERLYSLDEDLKAIDLVLEECLLEQTKIDHETAVRT